MEYQAALFIQVKILRYVVQEKKSQDLEKKVEILTQVPQDFALAISVSRDT